MRCDPPIDVVPLRGALSPWMIDGGSRWRLFCWWPGRLGGGRYYRLVSIVAGSMLACNCGGAADVSGSSEGQSGAPRIRVHRRG